MVVLQTARKTISENIEYVRQLRSTADRELSKTKSSKDRNDEMIFVPSVLLVEDIGVGSFWVVQGHIIFDDAQPGTQRRDRVAQRADRRFGVRIR